MKKPGFYLSEQDYIADLRAATNMEEHHRFPLTYIMEAADDISYCIADLDDAVEKDIFNVESLYEFLNKAWGPVKNNDAFSRTIGEAWREACSKKTPKPQRSIFYVTPRKCSERTGKLCGETFC